jgi:hypothetical protein
MADGSVTRPNLGLTSKWVDGDVWGPKMNANLDKLDWAGMPGVKDKDLTAPPGSPSNGDAYIVKATGTGAWAGHDKEVAVWLDSAWVFYVPKERWHVWIDDENAMYFFDGSNWLIYAPAGGGGGGVPGSQTRYALLSAMDFGTSPAAVEASTGSGTEYVECSFADTGDPELLATWVVPGDFASLTDFKLVIADSGADTGNSRWLLGVEKLTHAGQADVSFTHTASLSIASPGAVNKIAISAAFGSLALTLTAGDIVKIKIQRLSADPPDTATLAKRFVALLVTYTN